MPPRGCCMGGSPCLRGAATARTSFRLDYVSRFVVALAVRPRCLFPEGWENGEYLRGLCFATNEPCRAHQRSTYTTLSPLPTSKYKPHQKGLEIVSPADDPNMLEMENKKTEIDRGKSITKASTGNTNISKARRDEVGTRREAVGKIMQQSAVIVRARYSRTRGEHDQTELLNRLDGRQKLKYKAKEPPRGRDMLLRKRTVPPSRACGCPV